MIFKFHTAFAIGLVAMVAGTYLLAKVREEGTCCKGFAKVVGWFVVVTAFLGLICSTYYSVRYWQAGYYCPSKVHWGKPWKGRKMLHEKRMHMMGPQMMEEEEEE